MLGRRDQVGGQGAAALAGQLRGSRTGRGATAGVTARAEAVPYRCDESRRHIIFLPLLSCACGLVVGQGRHQVADGPSKAVTPGGKSRVCSWLGACGVSKHAQLQAQVGHNVPNVPLWTQVECRAGAPQHGHRQPWRRCAGVRPRAIHHALPYPCAVVSSHAVQLLAVPPMHKRSIILQCQSVSSRL